MAEIDRQAWERRWAAEPGLRPEGLEYVGLSGGVVWWRLDTPSTGVHIAEQHAAALICWRAVEWLAHGGCRPMIDTGGDDNYVTVSLGMIEVRRSGTTLLDALGAAVDVVLEARHA